MYMWYKRSGVCIAYLDDVEFGTSSEYMAASWFKRGWTLQELIAPSNVLIFNKRWTLNGTKHTLSGTISEATGIDELVLKTGNIAHVLVARKMSWASRRETTRIEDQAYYLLGIFDISIPTIYGEGKRAFIRLQEEVLKRSNDHTLFAWGTRKI